MGVIAMSFMNYEMLRSSKPSYSQTKLGNPWIDSSEGACCFLEMIQSHPRQFLSTPKFNTHLTNPLKSPGSQSLLIMNCNVQKLSKIVYFLVHILKDLQARQFPWIHTTDSHGIVVHGKSGSYMKYPVPADQHNELFELHRQRSGDGT